MKENSFERWHPFTQFLYYLSVVILVTIRMNPVIIAVTFVSTIVLGALVGKREFAKMFFMIYIPASLLAVIINPLFSHEGVTILAYFPDGNPLTLESIVYGAAGGVMVCSICALFFSFNTVMTSDRIMYLTGRLMPAIALTLSMSLRFIPEFKRHMRQVSRSCMCVTGNGGKIKKGIAVFESMVMWSFEKSIERSDSMRARGYGVGRRTSYSKYIFTKRDAAYAVLILTMSIFVLTNMLCGNIYSQYYPYYKIDGKDPLAGLTYVSYALLTMLPAMDIVKENIRWKLLKSKI
ncbi:MAG: energy-coupling factor transporter transmembrane protein EcfT [Lachnospiraceae bacterium]|nr:energy-coupling factor transporter transmembrane protein EcfT [Lachnospiraceae bacterium]